VTVAWHLMMAVAQTAASWGFFLYLIPRTMVRWQQAMELHHLGVEPIPLLGLGILGVASLANLWSRATLVWYGAGLTVLFTPPPNLVVCGPYAWLRNPIIATMIAQGLGVFVYHGSAFLVLYFGLLALGWHVMVRPVEEHELQRRFGREYEFYRRSTRLWLPMRSRFTPRAALPPISHAEVSVPRGRRHRHRR
jgi:protein-S-isoprenylcysteine O-methyltransferase Ste14